MLTTNQSDKRENIENNEILNYDYEWDLFIDMLILSTQTYIVTKQGDVGIK